MKKFLKTLLTVVITLLVLVIAVAAYLWIKNPFGIRQIAVSYFKTTVLKEAPTPVESPSTPATQNTKSPLSASQQQALTNAGVDVNSLPSTITPAQAQCAVSKLGQARADQIAGGATPTTAEIIKLLPCASAK